MVVKELCEEAFGAKDDSWAGGDQGRGKLGNHMGKGND